PGLKDPQTPLVPQDEDERKPMSSHYLLLIHPLVSHPDMLLSQIPRRIQRSIEDDETKDGLADYPIDGGNDGDDDDGDSSWDDTDEEEDDGG
ncbi:hypothetical protein Tco_0427131, partial [Tanacetum coccineum]